MFIWLAMKSVGLALLGLLQSQRICKVFMKIICFFIVDEASGVADPIMEAILGTLSGENNKLLMCGNPTKTTGTFYDSHTRDRALYKCHTVSSADSKRTNKENIESLIKKYGWESNVVRVRVRENSRIRRTTFYRIIYHRAVWQQSCLNWMMENYCHISFSVSMWHVSEMMKRLSTAMPEGN